MHRYYILIKQVPMYSDWRHPAKDNEVTTKDSLHSICDRAEIKTILHKSYNPIKYKKAAGECDGDSTLGSCLMSGGDLENKIQVARSNP